ncbi:MAG: c(7)-type cytochrome triheme domain-containing protein [Bryobacteraceae bacterium]
MRYLMVFLLCLSVVCLLSVSAQEVKPPTKLVFQTKMGNVTYDHAAHLKRAKGDCKMCHDKLFQQSAKAPLNFKPGMHKPAEANKTSCGACHTAGGMAFPTAGNCAKCHVKTAS